MSLLERLGGKPRADIRPLDFDDWLGYFDFNGTGYPFPMVNQTYAGGKTQEILPTFTGLAGSMLARNGIVWACVTTRNMLFAEAQFQYRRKGQIGSNALYGKPTLSLLEEPWPGGTTRKLLALLELHVQLAGNGYAWRDPNYAGTIRVLRPDWMTIILGSRDLRPNFQVGDPSTEIIGYAYRPGGDESRQTIILPDQMAHFMPHPDPIFPFRGASWLQPVIREIMSDNGMTEHKLRFLENGATPNMVVTLDPRVKKDEFDSWVEKFDAGHKSVANAYKCLHPSTDVALWNGARCEARDVRAGDLVVAWNDGKPAPGVVTAVETQPPSPIVTVTTQRGRTIKTNDAHPFLTRDGWVNAADLEAGDLLTTGLGWGRPRLQDSISADEAWMMGLLTGDGCLTQSSATVTISNEATVARLGGMATVKKKDSARAPYDYRVNGIMEKVRAAGLVGKRSWEKRVPASVMTGGSEVVAAFISGLIDADGHIADPVTRSSAEVGITSTSRELLRDVQHLLASLDINASISSPPSMKAGAVGGSSGAIRRHDAHRLHVLGNAQAAQLAAILSLSNNEKARRLAVFAQATSNQDRSRFDRVISVEIGTEEATIGIEVADHHTHVTGGVVTHNTIYLAGGADVKVVGANLKELDFRAIQAHEETRICNAAGIPPIVVGVSEGLDSATYSNYAQARRAWADSRLRPMWAGVCSELDKLVDTPGGSELWYDERRIAFLAEDLKDQASIFQTQAATLQSLIVAGWTPESAQAFIQTGDLSSLIHTGLYSIQLQAPGVTMNQAETAPQVQPGVPATAAAASLFCSLCEEPAGSNEHRCGRCAQLALDLRTKPTDVMQKVAAQLGIAEDAAAVALGLRHAEPAPLNMNGHKHHDFLTPALIGNGHLK